MILAKIKNLYSVCLLLLFLTTTAFSQDYLPELVKRIKPSAVAIETFDAKGATVSRGSGFFIAADKIITNRHVIEKSNRVEIHLMDGKTFPRIRGGGNTHSCHGEFPLKVSGPGAVIIAI